MKTVRESEGYLLIRSAGSQRPSIRVPKMGDVPLTLVTLTVLALTLPSPSEGEGKNE
jgi:hypothetical protein